MNKKIRYAVLAAMMAAFVFLFTAYVLHIPVGIGGGYIHLGDMAVYIAAALLPTPYAVLAAALGGGLADVLTGAAMWAVPTILIKSLMVLTFTAKQPRLLCRRNVLALFFAGVIGVVGYAFAEIALVTLSGGGWQAAVTGSLAAVLPNVAQETAAGIGFALFALFFDRIDGKSRLLRGV